MSLRTFHVIFIVCAIILAGWFGYWSIQNSHLWTGIGSFIAAVGLIIYECNFLKKVKG